MYHEAGYDAYCAGHVFIQICIFLWGQVHESDYTNFIGHFHMYKLQPLSIK